MTEPAQAAQKASARSIMPPHLVLRDVLPAETVQALLDFAESQEAAFAPSGVGDHARDPTIRVSRVLRPGPFRAMLKARALELAPDLIAGLRLTPFEISKVELELVAHGDGAFYARHIDISMSGAPLHVRVLSGVYYFHRQPRAFDGGALRLYAIGDDSRFVDLEPASNTLVAFPSWAPHEVRPVSCPSGRFGDSRFAVNIWLRKRRAG